MLKRPATISIAPSKLRLGVMLLLATGVCVLVTAYGPSWLVVTAPIVLGSILWLEGRRQGRWELRWVPGDEGGWQRRSRVIDEWRDATLSCDYLGPWLIGLRIDGRRRWLWPDSANRQGHRSLRRRLLWSSSGR